jgi:hypothetical protein
MSSGVINDGDIRKVIMTRVSIIDTATKLKDVLGRNVSKAEIDGLIGFMKSQNFNTFRGGNPDVVRELLAKKFGERVTQHSGGGYTIDVKEMLKRSIGRINVTDGPNDDLGTVFNHNNSPADIGNSSMDQLRIHSDTSDNPDVNIQHGYEKFDPSPITNAIGSLKSDFRMLRTIQDVYSAYVLLDSRYRKIQGVIGNPITRYTWEYTPTIYTESGTTNSVSRIQDVLYMQIQPFYIPYTPAADNVYRRVSMLVDEFSALAVVAHENRRYHYMLQSERDGNRIRLDPPSTDEGKYRFSTPINRVDQLTISFGAPLTSIVFEPDRFNITIAPINPLETHLVFPQAHNMTNGEIVILSGYTTGAALADEAKINIINQLDGHVVNVVNATTLSIAINLTLITLPVPTPLVECYITTRRMLIPLRLVYAHKPVL